MIHIAVRNCSDHLPLCSFAENIFKILIPKRDSRSPIMVESITKENTDLSPEFYFANSNISESNKYAQNQFDKFAKLVKNFVKKNGFNATSKQYLLEAHSYNLTKDKYTKDKPLKSHLSWHEDDYGGVSMNVVTIVFYLHKSSTIKGGNFLFHPGNISDHTIIDVDSGTIVIFDGNLTHKVQDAYGLGTRESVVIQLQRLAN